MSLASSGGRARALVPMLEATFLYAVSHSPTLAVPADVCKGRERHDLFFRGAGNGSFLKGERLMFSPCQPCQNVRHLDRAPPPTIARPATVRGHSRSPVRNERDNCAVSPLVFHFTRERAKWNEFINAGEKRPGGNELAWRGVACHVITHGFKVI